MQERVTREALYELVWAEPMLKVAEKFGVSATYLARVCTELRIPRPGRGHWAKLEFGKPSAKSELPAARQGDVTDWRPGDAIGTTERSKRRHAALESIQRVSAPERPDGDGQPSTRQRFAQRAGSRSHPLLIGVAKHFDKVRESRHDDNGILRPYKLSMPDFLTSRDKLGAAIDLARDLYLALESRGHRVAMVGRAEQFSRPNLDLREVPTQRYLPTTWAPDRATVVYVGDFPVGLTLFEMTEATEVMYMGDSRYVPVKSLTQEQQRRFTGHPHHWTTTQDGASGRFCLQAYCGVWDVKWEKRWAETKPKELRSLFPAIIAELESAAPALAGRVEASKAAAEERHRRWEEDSRRRREEAERAAQLKRREDSRAELMAAIEQWDQVRRIQEYFNAIEASLVGSETGQDDKQLSRVRQRLAKARDLVGAIDPLVALLSWKAPDERG